MRTSGSQIGSPTCLSSRDLQRRGVQVGGVSFRAAHLIIPLLAVILVGCEETYQRPGTVKVTGTITDGGTPLHVEGRDVRIGWVSVSFSPIPPEDQIDRQLVVSGAAQVDAEGKFDLVDGIEPGEYQITIQQWDPYPQRDRLKGKFDAKNSKIIRNITEDTELHIDISNPDGSGPLDQ